MSVLRINWGVSILQYVIMGNCCTVRLTDGQNERQLQLSILQCIEHCMLYYLQINQPSVALLYLYILETLEDYFQAAEDKLQSLLPRQEALNKAKNQLKQECEKLSPSTYWEERSTPKALAFIFGKYTEVKNSGTPVEVIAQEMNGWEAIGSAHQTQIFRVCKVLNQFLTDEWKLRFNLKQ